MMLITIVAVLPTIWIVDASNGPGTNFTNLPPAVTAAASGDTIIVKAGAYSTFNATGKALTIIGAGASMTSLVSSLGARIDSVPAGMTFYVEGLKFGASLGGTSNSVPAGLRVSGATTKVVLTDVVMEGKTVTLSGLMQTGGVPGLLVVGGAEVHLSRSTATGGNGGSYAAAEGARVEGGCKLAADASTFIGGAGTNGGYEFGGSGMVVLGSSSLSRCSAFGGASIWQTGDGITVTGFVRVAGTVADVIKAGTPGVSTAPFPGIAINAYQGATGVVVHGSVTLLPALPNGALTSGAVTLGAPVLPYLALTGTTTSGGALVASQPVTLFLDGVLPSAPFVLAIATAASFSSYAPLILGEVLIPDPPGVLIQGNLDPVGAFQETATPAAAAPAIVGFPIYLQAGVFDVGASQFRVSNGLVRLIQ